MSTVYAQLLAAMWAALFTIQALHHAPLSLTRTDLVSVVCGTTAALVEGGRAVAGIDWHHPDVLALGMLVVFAGALTVYAAMVLMDRRARRAAAARAAASPDWDAIRRAMLQIAAAADRSNRNDRNGRNDGDEKPAWRHYR